MRTAARDPAAISPYDLALACRITPMAAWRRSNRRAPRRAVLGKRGIQPTFLSQRAARKMFSTGYSVSRPCHDYLCQVSAKGGSREFEPLPGLP
jgi:hypothetical protein